LLNSLSVHAITQYALGNTKKADEYLGELMEKYSDTSAYTIARVYGHRGDVDKTIEWLYAALENNNRFLLPFLLGEPAFRSVYSDPRWQTFLEQLGLLEFWLEMPS